MTIGVIDGKPFGQGGGVEFGIGREQRHRRVGCMDFQNRSELHGIIAAQTMPSRQRRCLGDQPGRHLDDAVLAGEIELEIRHGGRGVLGRDRAPTLPPRDGGYRFGQRHPHDKERMPDSRSGQGLHPARAGFLSSEAALSADSRMEKLW